MLIEGSCHCGSIRFEAEVEPDQVALCHCSDCQQLTGSAYRVTVTAAADRFKLLAATPKLYVKHGDNGRKRKQYFCGDCGSPIYTTGEGADAAVVGIRVGVINQRHQLYPRAQIWCSSALPWVDDIASLPKHEED